MADEQLDYGDEEFGGSQKMQYHGDGAIPALADDEIGGEDDEYDDLYNDVNVGEGFLQMQRSEALPTSNVGNGGFHDQKANVPEARPEPMASQNINIPGVAAESAYQRVPDNKDGMTVDLMQKRMAPQVTNDVQAASMGFRGSIPVPQNPAVDPVSMPGTMTNEPAPMLNSNSGHPVGGVSQMPGNQMGANANVNMARPMVNENQARPPADNGATTLFVGELHWWTTDAELENVLSQYGRVKEIKFFDERASGKSKGYCQVDFYESGSAAACKDGMNGYVFNGRPCVVAFASPQTMRQMGASYANKNQGPAQSQPELQGRRPMNDGAGRGGGTKFSGGDAGRNFGRGNWGGRGQQRGVNRGGAHMRGVNRGGAHMRGTGGMGPKNANTPGFGGPAGGAYGQGLGGGPAFGGPPGGFMHPQGMMGGGFDPTHMGRGAGYGGFPGSGFPGMMPQFPGVNPMGIAWPPADNGAMTLFVGELHYWTTEAELENVLSQYGRVREIKFFVERASGKSKGYCQVDFYESGSAAACKDGMNGYVFNGRPCVVTSDCKVEDSTIMLEIKIKMLETKIKMMEASLELKRNSEDQACQSVAMLHKLLYDMENLRM